jgi:ankyrin repeat protein
MVASGFGNLTAVRILIEHGASPSLVDPSGKSAVDYAASAPREIRDELIAVLRGRSSTRSPR